MSKNINCWKILQTSILYPMNVSPEQFVAGDKCLHWTKVKHRAEEYFIFTLSSVASHNGIHL